MKEIALLPEDEPEMDITSRHEQDSIAIRSQSWAAVVNPQESSLVAL